MFTAMPASIIDGWKGWHEGMAHLQLGEFDGRSTFSVPGAYTHDLPGAGDRAGVAWFWSMIAQRRGDFTSAAILLGFPEALSKQASMRLLAFDRRLVDESSSAVREALGPDEYEELMDRGANTTWEDLPLIHSHPIEGDS